MVVLTDTMYVVRGPDKERQMCRPCVEHCGFRRHDEDESGSVQSKFERHHNHTGDTLTMKRRPITLAAGLAFLLATLWSTVPGGRSMMR
jgi:hypothetical protein